MIEFTQFVRPSRLHTHIVEGPHPVDGTWVFIAAGHGTRVDFVASPGTDAHCRADGQAPDRPSVPHLPREPPSDIEARS